jgi:hypothetical protein
MIERMLILAILAAFAPLTEAGPSTAAARAPTLTARQIVERIQERAGGRDLQSWRGPTVDTLKAGDLDTPVTGVVTTFSATMEILQRAFENAKPRLEVKARRVGGATYQVPIEASGDRGLSLALRWVVNFADARKGVPMNEALAAEIMDAYQGQGNAIRKRDEVHKMAQANKAFAHFRW